jgi:hypothetical protein
MSLVVGRDIVLSDIIKSKKQTDTTLWKHATSTLKTCKKAMTLLPRLAPKMVQLDNTKRIVGYSSGINFSSVLQAINNGMYLMGDNETFVRVTNKQNDGVEDDSSVQMMVDKGADWDPFDGEEAPNGWMFLGYMSFALLGPGAEDPCYFSPLLRTNIKDNMTKEERNALARSSSRKHGAKMQESERQDRKNNSINMQTNCDIATIALAKAEAGERAEDRSFLALNSKLDGKRLEVDLVGKLLQGCDDPEELTELRSDLKKLRTEIREITEELGKWTSRASAPNKLVDSLLSNAEKMMGIKGDKDESGKETTVVDLVD